MTNGADCTSDGRRGHDAGRRSTLRARHPRLRWCSSSVERERSLHLIVCRSPATCSRAEPSPWGDGSLVLVDRPRSVLPRIAWSSPAVRRT